MTERLLPAYGVWGRLGPGRHFSWGEVRCRDGSLPLDRESRRRYARQAHALNELRAAVAARMGVSVDHVTVGVNSWYRSPSYNRHLAGAATHSQHIERRATDVRVFVQLTTGRRVQLAPKFVSALAATHVPLFRDGGIGTYGPLQGNFTHVDHRPGRARW